MPFSTEAKNQMLDAELGSGATSGTWAALCRQDPGVNYANALAFELTGAPYARVQLNLNAAVGGQKTLAAQPTLQVPGGNTIVAVAYWRVQNGGVAAQFIGSVPLAAGESFGSDGQYTLTSETWQAL